MFRTGAATPIEPAQRDSATSTPPARTPISTPRPAISKRALELATEARTSRRGSGSGPKDPIRSRQQTRFEPWSGTAAWRASTQRRSSPRPPACARSPTTGVVFLQREADLDIEDAVFVSPSFLRQKDVERLLQDRGFRNLDPQAILTARLANLTSSPTTTTWSSSGTQPSTCALTQPLA